MYEHSFFVDDHRKNQPFRITFSGYSHCDETYKIVRKNSHIYCFEYIYAGEGTVHLDDITFHPKAGDVYWLPAGHNQIYYSSETNPWKKIWFNIRGELVSSILEAYKINHKNHIQSFNSPELFEKFFKVVQSKKTYAEITDECALIFLKLVQNLAQHATNLSDTKKNDSDLETALTLKMLLDHERQFNNTLDNYVTKLYCTKAHAIRVFKKHFGITPYQYLLNRKLHVAKIMLTDTTYSIKEISISLCFDDPHNFSIFFKKQTGLSPSEYRKSKKS